MKGSTTGSSSFILEFQHTFSNIGTDNLYKENAFRTLGISVNSNQQDINKQVRLHEMRVNFGNEMQKSAFSLKDFPSLESVNEAKEKLKEPVKRIINEFFWFWPLHSDTRNDRALKAIASNEPEKAINIWKENEEHNASALHNLAVFYHIQALEENKQDSWNEAVSKWRKLEDTENFWQQLRERIEVLKYPMLTSSTPDIIKKNYPITIISVNTFLACKAFEKKDDGSVEQHFNIIKESGFNKKIINDTLLLSVKPKIEEIKKLCTSLHNDAKKNINESYTIAKKIHENTSTTLSLIDLAIPGDNYQKDTHDKVANTMLDVIIEYGNETKRWEEFCEITEISKKIAMGKATKERVVKNLKVGEQNLEDAIWNSAWNNNNEKSYKEYLKKYPNGYYALQARNALESLSKTKAFVTDTAGPAKILSEQPQSCYYCATNIPSAKSAIHTTMQKGRNTERVTIPRCDRCKTIHMKTSLSRILSIIIAFITSFFAYRYFKETFNALEIPIIAFWAILAITISSRFLLISGLSVIAGYFVYKQYGELQTIENSIIIFWSTIAVSASLGFNLLYKKIPVYIKKKKDIWNYNKINQLANQGWFLKNIK